MDREIVVENRNRTNQVVALPVVALTSGLVAAVVHAAVVREHLTHWWGYGVFFAVVAVVQAMAAIAVYRSPTRKLLVAVAIMDAALIVLYTLSRTLATSFVGPHAGEGESVKAVDVVSKAAELAQLVAVTLMARRSFEGSRRPLSVRRFAFVALVALVAVSMSIPGAPAHLKTPRNTIQMLARDRGVALPTPHIMPTEEPPSVPAEDPVVNDEPPPPCTPHASGEAGGSIADSGVVYSHAGDLWLASPPDGDVRRLTTDEGDCWAVHATFRDADTITLATDSAVYDLDLDTGDLRPLVQVQGGAAGLSWSPDGKRLAILDWSIGLILYSPSTGSTESVRTFGEALGRCGDMSDETKVSWSHDGRALLVVSTILEGDGTMFVVNLDGKDLVAPRSGTHARWMPNSSRILYRGFDAPTRWYMLNVETARSEGVAMHAGTHHAAVSPDGRYIAYSDDADSPTLYLYDISKDDERVLTHGYGAPIWLSSSEVAVTKTVPCDENCMMEHGWMEGGETAAFDLQGHLTRKLSMKTTTDAAVFMRPEDSPSPEPSPTAPSPSPSPTESANPLPLPTDPPATSPEPSPTPTSAS